MKTLKFAKLVSVTLLSLSSAASLANWELDAEVSSLSFVSIKNNTVAEVHQFATLDGRVSDDGSAVLNIALDSVESHIPIRNERMRKLLFETAKFAQATAKVDVDMQVFTALKEGAETSLAAEVHLDLHGVKATLPADLRVTRLSKKRYRVATERPLIVNAADFNLLPGIEALREIAKLKAIGTAVPVTLVLSFTAD